MLRKVLLLVYITYVYITYSRDKKNFSLKLGTFFVLAVPFFFPFCCTAEFLAITVGHATGTLPLSAKMCTISANIGTFPAVERSLSFTSFSLLLTALGPIF
jgi:hypothetical protein